MNMDNQMIFEVYHKKPEVKKDEKKTVGKKIKQDDERLGEAVKPIQAAVRLDALAEHAIELKSLLSGEVPNWVEDKIALACDYIESIYDHMKYGHNMEDMDNSMSPEELGHEAGEKMVVDNIAAGPSSPNYTNAVPNG